MNYEVDVLTGKRTCEIYFKPYMCKICKSLFQTSKSLKSHLYRCNIKDAGDSIIKKFVNE